MLRYREKIHIRINFDLYYLLMQLFQVTKRSHGRQKPSSDTENVAYKHNNTHFYSKISFFWLNLLLYRGYEAPLENDDLGELPEQEQSRRYYHKFKRIYEEEEAS